jgi:CRP/FNR family transcriptional regulator, cyclic AMP receptor protein
MAAAAILEAAAGLPVTVLGPRGVLVAGGASTGKLYVLKSGDLEIVREGSVVASFGEPGDVVGEMSVLLEKPHTATVRSRMGAEVHVVDDPVAFLDTHPAVSRHIARSLAQRLEKTTALLIDLRAQMKDRQDHELADRIFALLK